MAMLESFISGALTQKMVRIKAFQKCDGVKPFRTRPVGSIKKEAMNIDTPM
jgi:hypothetical protein